MVDTNPAVVKLLQTQATKLGADGADIICADALGWLKANSRQFDIVYLDPPFSKKQLGNVMAQLLNCGTLHQGSLVYIESDGEFTDEDPRLRVLKQGKAGVVHFRLFEYSER
jgi:16S rRNA (guanine966-N2)-methyltransferase